MIKYILTLSHEKVSIERGFSINKNMEVENLKEWSSISLRIMKDCVEYCGSIFQVPIIKDLLANLLLVVSRQRCILCLKEQQEEKETY